MSAMTLRLFACATMLADHIGYAWGILPLRLVGRLAFPIFAFLIYNGYRHTSSKPRYALRLALFALISQVPFSLFCYNTPWHSKGNVFFTLLAALLCLWSVDVMMKRSMLRWFTLVPSLAVCLMYYRGLLRSDYGATGILMVLVFYLFDGNKILTGLGVLVAIYDDYIFSLSVNLLLLLLDRPPHFSAPSQRQLWQTLALGALPLIWSYRGKKGTPPRWLPPEGVQYGFYLFYPVHLLVLWGLQILF